MSEQNAIKLFSEARTLTGELSAAGWINAVDNNAYSTADPANLFADEIASRPLVAGLFGGTGVGKSALLNRLAGADIARTGVVRPTSMEITAYLHSDQHIAQLPRGFPEGQFSEHRHNTPQYRDVVWVDMPDFDSEETQNRDQVLQWLPYIDLLIYVVTPERYKDEEGWRLLLDNGYRHGWLFVMNQWDRAVEEQLDDFNSMLEKAGFTDPVVFRTVSNRTDHPQDESDELGTCVAKLSERNTVAQLDERGWLQRLRVANEKLREQVEVLEQAESEISLELSCKRHWQQATQAIQANLEIPFREFSAGFGEDRLNPLKKMLKSVGGPVQENVVARQIASRADVKTLWDEWSVTRLTDSLNKFQMAEADHGVPEKRLRSTTMAAVDLATELVRSQLENGLSESLTRPGTRFQRGAGVVLKYLCILLPLAALVWVGYRIVNGFVAGAEDPGAYVNFNMLVNGLMLTGLAWVVPWAVTRLLVPSVPESVYRGLKDAVTNGLALASDQLVSKLALISKEKDGLLIQARQLSEAIAKTQSRSAILQNAELKKVLMAYPAERQELDP